MLQSNIASLNYLTMGHKNQRHQSIVSSNKRLQTHAILTKLLENVYKTPIAYMLLLYAYRRPTTRVYPKPTYNTE